MDRAEDEQDGDSWLILSGAMYSHLDPSKAYEFAMDHAQMLNLAQTFHESLEKDLQSLHAALTQHESEPVQRLLHSLKGYVTFLCGPDLSQQMIHLEAMSRSKSLSELADEIAKITPSLQSLLSEIQLWINKDLRAAG
ncbi:MAG: Hpt domain-containing protein [Betaproteobacteria bacterium]|jgi:HPt (histidine-containing phosphotransfer) domain-containing protein|nr:Hpt domain-containing protein [Betaproteobacteria bacterium]